MHIVKRSSEILSFLLILTRPVLLFLNGNILDSVFKNKEMWVFFMTPYIILLAHLLLFKDR